jgi:hypothetical protein
MGRMAERKVRLALLLIANGAAIVLLAVVLAEGDQRAQQATVPTPDAAEQARDTARYALLDPGEFIGAKIGASENQIATDEPLTFDHAKFDTGGLWDPDEPTRLTVPHDGFYYVTAQLTILGSAYPGSAPAPDVWVEVIRNGDPTDFVCVNRKTNQDETAAAHVFCATTDWFLAGDYLEVFAPPGTTVESNWPGRGNVSPVLIVERRG